MAYNPRNANGQATSANSAPVVIASDQSAIPISASSLPLPTGAATSAKQDTLLAELQNKADLTETQPVSLASVPSHAVTNAGTFAVQATEADGANTTLGAKADAKSSATDTTAISIMSVLKQISASVQAPPSQAVTNVGTFAVQAATAGDVASGSTDSGNPVKVGAKFNSTQPTFTDGQRGDLQINSRGELKVTITNAGNSAAVSTSGADGSSNTVNSLATTGYGKVYNGSTWDRMPGSTAGTYDIIRDAAGNSRGANVNASNQLSVSVDNSPVLGAGTALVGKVGIDQTTPGTTNAVVDTPVTSGGLSIVTGSVGATATAIKASAGQLYGYHLFNTTAAVAYVQIFNVAAGSVSLGTTAPTMSIGIPASGGVTVNWDKGLAFGTAISYACTTTRAGSSGATCDVNFFFK